MEPSGKWCLYIVPVCTHRGQHRVLSAVEVSEHGELLSDSRVLCLQGSKQNVRETGFTTKHEPMAM